MARFRRRRFAGLRDKPATAFAPGESKRGKTIAWESIYSAKNQVPITSAIPNVVRAAGNFTTYQVSLIPINVTRGTVTLERIRGCMDVYFDSSELASNFENWTVFMQIQMAPARNGAFVNAAILSPGNSADQESNKIIWQRLYYPTSRHDHHCAERRRDARVHLRGPGNRCKGQATLRPRHVGNGPCR